MDCPKLQYFLPVAITSTVVTYFRAERIWPLEPNAFTDAPFTEPLKRFSHQVLMFRVDKWYFRRLTVDALSCFATRLPQTWLFKN